MKRRPSIQRMQRAEKRKLIELIRAQAGEGKTTEETAAALATAYPDWLINFGTIKNLAYQNNIRFFGYREGAVHEPVSQEELATAVKLEREIENLKARLRDSERKYKEAQRETTVAEEVVAEIIPEVTRFKPVIPKVYQVPKGEARNVQDLVLLISCLHFGEVVSREETNGLGHYNPELACARLQFYIERAIELATKEHSGTHFERVWLIDVGDNGSGDIHDELKITNEYTLGEQVVKAAHLLGFALRDLAAVFPQVTFIGTIGNHLRFTKKPPAKQKVTNNGDWVIYNFVRELMAGQPNVEVLIPDAPWAAPVIRGHQMYASHGDNLRSYFSLPWYDSNRFVASMSSMFAEQKAAVSELWMFGHFHQYMNQVLQYSHLIFTGSAKGPDEYSINKLRAATPPLWIVFGVTDERAKTFLYDVDMRPATPEKFSRYLSVLD